jgi:hypothetical protein
MTDLMLGQWALLPKEEVHKMLVEEGKRVFGPHLVPQEVVKHRPAFLSLNLRVLLVFKSLSALTSKIRPYFHSLSPFSRPH